MMCLDVDTSDQKAFVYLHFITQKNFDSLKTKLMMKISTNTSTADTQISTHSSLFPSMPLFWTHDVYPERVINIAGIFSFIKNAAVYGC